MMTREVSKKERINMKYTVKITEVSKGFVEVEAESREKAIELVESDYFKHANDYFLEPYEVDFE